MSYDLMVFDPNAAPRERGEFSAWYQKQVDWPDDDSGFDPATSSPALQKWYEAMLADWPNMQEVSDDEVDNPRITDYSFGPSIIYIGYRWSEADDAYDTTRRLALEHGVGFYDVSGDEGDGEIFFPGDELRPPSDGAWRNVAADFRSGNLSKYIPPMEPAKRRWFDFFRRK
ncbi:MAG: hypothetical protein AABY88_03855 [Pseudomonadota bacterium]